MRYLLVGGLVAAETFIRRHQLAEDDYAIVATAADAREHAGSDAKVVWLPGAGWLPQLAGIKHSLAGMERYTGATA